MTVLPLTRGPAPETASTSALRFAGERAQDHAAVDALIDRAFGPGRFAKTAERLREGVAAHPELSVCAWLDGRLAGAVRLWPAHIGEAAVLFLGPIAVERSARRHGVGAQMVGCACVRASALGEAGVVLVGDVSFFGPLGFEPAPPGRVRMPGPVDPGRVLWRALRPGGLDRAAGRLAVGAPA